MGTLLNRRRYMGASGGGEQGHNLPAEYQEVQYIQNNGTSSASTLATGFGFNFNAYTFECVFSMDSKPQRNRQSVFSTQFSNNQQFQFVYEISNPQKMNFCFSNKVDITVSNFNSDKHTLKYIGSSSAQEFWYDGVLKNSWSYTDLPSTTFYSLSFFAGGAIFNGKIYYSCLKETSDGTIKFEYIPCYRKSDSMPGFYDLATDTFKTITDADQYYACGPNVN